jgi:hypothetical protein
LIAPKSLAEHGVIVRTDALFDIAEIEEGLPLAGAGSAGIVCPD